MKDKIKLFTTAFLQVTFVSMNVVFISKNLVLPMILTGFLISFLWSSNVRKIAFGGMRDRIYYASGAAIGTYFGYVISHLILTIWL